MRGWSPEHSPEPAEEAVVPAHAGVVPRSGRSRPCSCCGPRACGGGPLGLSVVLLAELVVPAHAGVVPRGAARRAGARRGPRACGGGPFRLMEGTPWQQWSPRMRGWSQILDFQHRYVFVVPAHAGVVPRPAHHHARRAGGPRACGGGPGQ
ncbi:protein of unknown function [Streptomyces murinus]